MQSPTRRRHNRNKPRSWYPTPPHPDKSKPWPPVTPTEESIMDITIKNLTPADIDTFETMLLEHCDTGPLGQEYESEELTHLKGKLFAALADARKNAEPRPY